MITEAELKQQLETTKKSLKEFEDEYIDIIRQHDYIRGKVFSLEQSIKNEIWRVGRCFKISESNGTYYIKVSSCGQFSVSGKLIRIVPVNEEDGKFKSNKFIKGNVRRFYNQVFEEITPDTFENLWNKKYKNLEVIEK